VTAQPPTPPGDRTAPVVISAVIVTWNSREVALNCLASLEANGPSVPWEVIVVDNGSRDGSVDAIRRAAPWARVIANPTNRGLPAANNQGMLAARGEHFLISNPDVIWHPGAVDAMYDVLGRHPRAAWIIPRILYEDGTPQTSAGRLPNLAEALAGRQLERWRPRKEAASGQWFDEWAHDEERAVPRGGEAGYLVRRAAVEEIGLQDERYKLDWEGLDWTARLRDAGWEVWLSPMSEAIHLGGASIRQVRFRSIVSSHRGMYLYFADRRPPAAKPVLASIIAVRAAAKLLAAATGLPMYQLAYRPPVQPARVTSPGPPS